MVELGAVLQYPRVLGLGGVHRDLGVLKQRIDIGVAAGRRHEADARRHRQRQSADLDLGGDDVAQTPQRLLRVGDVAEDETELISAQPGDGVTRPHVGVDALGQSREELVPASMAERVVDVLEVVEVDDRDRHRRTLRRHLGDSRSRASEEQRAVGKVGERVVMGEKRVDRQLAAQPSAGRHGDEAEEEIERAQAEAQVDVEVVQPGADVARDRRIREVDLEHTDAASGIAGVERQVDLNRPHAGRSVVVAVGVEVGQPSDGLAACGVNGLVLGPVSESRAVVGPHDVAGQIAQTQAQHPALLDGAADDPAQLGSVRGGDPLAQGPFVKLGPDGGLADESGLGAPLGQPTAIGLLAKGGSEHHAEPQHGDRRDEGVDHEQPRHGASRWGRASHVPR